MSNNGSLKRRVSIIAKARFEFALLVITAFGSGLIGYLLYSPNIASWVVASIAVGLVVVVLFLILMREERITALTAAQDVENRTALEIKNLEKAITTDRRDEAINLMQHAIEVSTRSLRTVYEELKQYQLHPHADKESSIFEFQLLKQRMLFVVCRNIRTIFQEDPRGVDTTSWPHNWFKVGLYEPEPKSPNAPYTALKRTFHDYPEGMEIHEESELVNFARFHRCAMVLAFLTENIIIIEDVKREEEKPLDAKRWMDLRDGQSAEYASMICIPIISGIKGQPGRRCLGVLVIDTNRERYFLEERDFEAFLGAILSPFRTILSFILDLESYLPTSPILKS
jgi:hypothetical protein